MKIFPLPSFPSPIHTYIPLITSQNKFHPTIIPQKISKISETSSDHGPVVTSYTGQNRLKSETETPSYYSYFNSETSSSVEFDSCSSSSDDSYINYDPKDVMIWETFVCQPCDTEEDLLDWLEHNKPSKINIKGMLPTIVKKYL